MPTTITAGRLCGARRSGQLSSRVPTLMAVRWFYKPDVEAPARLSTVEPSFGASGPDMGPFAGSSCEQLTSAPPYQRASNRMIWDWISPQMKPNAAPATTMSHSSSLNAGRNKFSYEWASSSDIFSTISVSISRCF